jgi:hypothetical protein
MTSGMTDRRNDTPATGDDDARAGPARRGSAPASRDARLKAALKANIARRKARSQMLDDGPSQAPDDPIPPEPGSNEPDSPQPDSLRKD